MKIKQKLVSSFLLMAALVLTAGLVGVFASWAIGQSTDVILDEKSPLKDISMEAIISLQEGTHAASEYLLRDDNLQELEDRIHRSVEDFDMWISMVRFGTDAKAFTDSPAGVVYREREVDIISPPGTEEMLSVALRADEHHEDFTGYAKSLMDTHGQKIKYYFDYSDKRWDFLSFLYLVELQHKMWLEELSEAAADGVAFTGETDPTRCFFGQWFYNYSIDDPALQKLLTELEPHHTHLHESALDVNAAPTAEAKTGIFQELVRPAKDRIEGMFGNIRGYIEPLFDSLEEAETSQLGQMREASNASIEELENLEALVDRDMRAAMVEADRAQQVAFIIMTGVSAAGLAVAIVVGLLLSLSIARPLAGITRLSERVARGDLEAEKLEVKTRDELYELNEAFSAMMESFRYKAGIIDRIAGGDLTVEVRKSSGEDSLGESLLQMKTSLHDLVSRVSAAISEVSEGSDHVSEAGQTLSQGATEQASALEEISSSLTEVNGRAKENAGKADNAAGLAGRASEDAQAGNRQMESLTAIMERISDASGKIAGVVKIIDDIAFQINLLALNANVEAARAGKYGKGFAVVAEEVRNLAVKSAEAVRDTTGMVEETLSAITAGRGETEKTAKQLKAIVEGSGEVAGFLQEIAEASREQAIALDQVSEGIEQIDQVTQSNTASSEEIASAAEELASQAQFVRSLVGEFRIGDRLALPEESDRME